MTLDELDMIFAAHCLTDRKADRRAGLRAVVEALRDEFVMMGMRDFSSDFDIKKSRVWFDKILASDGEVKAAGASTRKDEVGARTPAPSPAAAYCPSCLNPIKSEAAR